MPARAEAAALPHAAPDARRDFKLLVVFLIALQVLVVAGAARSVEAVNAVLRAHVPAASDAILPEVPRPPVTRLAGL